MSRTRSEVEDLVNLLENMLIQPTVPMQETTVCSKCGCLQFPSDPYCYGCRAIAMRKLNL